MNRKGSFRATQLRLVAPSVTFRDSREPPLRIGDWVRLNSGSPICLVVDAHDGTLTVARRNTLHRIEESTLPIACFHRVCLSSI
jgi:hypothetical protein